MRDHETGLQTGTVGEKRRQPLAFVGINQAIGAPLANAHQIGHCDRGVVKRQRERGAVEISSRDDVTALDKDERIIRRRRRLNQENVFAMCERIANSAVHLRHAANAVSVLYSRIVLSMRFTNFASFEQPKQVRGGGFLAAMRARLLQTRIESGWSVSQSFQ